MDSVEYKLHLSCTKPDYNTHLISNISQVLLPSPHGVFRVEILRFLVGRRTGPFTRNSFVLALSMSSLQTFSKAETLREVRVMRILWIFGESCCDDFFGSWNDILMADVVAKQASSEFAVK